MVIGIFRTQWRHVVSGSIERPAGVLVSTNMTLLVFYAMNQNYWFENIFVYKVYSDCPDTDNMSSYIAFNRPLF